MRKFSPFTLIILVCAAIFISGCTVPSVPSVSPASSPQPMTAVSQPPILTSSPASNGIVKNVIIIQRAFDPDQVTITPGTTVVWTNEDTISHRVIHLPELPSDRELFHSELLSKGDSFSYTFPVAGRYYYSDPQYAGGRKALVIVQ